MQIHYMVLGGSDITDAYVHNFALATSAATQDVTVVSGFGKPDLMIWMSAAATALADTATHAAPMFGVAKSATERFCSLFADADAADTMLCAAWQNTRAILSVNPATPTQDAEADLADKASWPTDGYRLSFVDQASIATQMIGLALKGTFTSKVTYTDSPLSTGNVDIDHGSVPNGALLFATSGPKTAAWVSFGDLLGVFGLGAMDGSDEVLAGAGNDDATGAAYPVIMNSISKTIRIINIGVPVIAAEADGAIVGNNIRLGWTTVDSASQHRVGFVSFGSGAGGGTYYRTVSVTTSEIIALKRASKRMQSLTVGQVVTVGRKGKLPCGVTASTAVNAPSLHLIFRRLVSVATSAIVALLRKARVPCAVTASTAVGAPLRKAKLKLALAVGAAVALKRRAFLIRSVIASSVVNIIRKARLPNLANSVSGIVTLKRRAGLLRSVVASTAVGIAMRRALHLAIAATTTPVVAIGRKARLARAAAANALVTFGRKARLKAGAAASTVVNVALLRTTLYQVAVGVVISTAVALSRKAFLVRSAASSTGVSLERRARLGKAAAVSAVAAVVKRAKLRAATVAGTAVSVSLKAVVCHQVAVNAAIGAMVALARRVGINRQASPVVNVSLHRQAGVSRGATSSAIADIRRKGKLVEAVTVTPGASVLRRGGLKATATAHTAVGLVRRVALRFGATISTFVSVTIPAAGEVFFIAAGAVVSTAVAIIRKSKLTIGISVTGLAWIIERWRFIAAHFNWPKPEGECDRDEPTGDFDRPNPRPTKGE